MIKEPIGYRIIGVVEDLGETASKGSKIVIPENVRAKEKLATQVAYVKLIGPKAFDGEPVLEIGDRIMYGKYAGVRVDDPDTGEQLIILNDEDVIAKMGDPNA